MFPKRNIVEILLAASVAVAEEVLRYLVGWVRMRWIKKNEAETSEGDTPSGPEYWHRFEEDDEEDRDDDW